MKFIKKNFLKSYREAHKVGRRHIIARPYVVPMLGLLMGIAIVGGLVLAKPSNLKLRPSDSHVVFVSDSGHRETLDTQAKTVGDLIKKLPLKLIDQDVVEPSLDTPIVQDNFRINIYRARPVTVVSGDAKTVALTAQSSPREVATDAGVQVYPEDYVNFAPGSVSANIIGEKVQIDPATPVNMTLYGTPLNVRTHVKTVSDLLKEKNLKLTKDDTLTPTADTLVTPGMSISVVRNGTVTANIDESIAPPVQYVSDTNLSLGATATRQNGVAGKKTVTYQITTQNGVEVSRTVIQEVVVTQPVPTIIARGTVVDIAGNKTTLMAAAGISSGDYGYADYIISHESNWNPTAQNASGAYGLCQALPGSKMASAGPDWATNPVTQLRWCNGYAVGHYGSWYNAYLFWVSHRYW